MTFCEGTNKLKHEQIIYNKVGEAKCPLCERDKTIKDLTYKLYVYENFTLPDEDKVKEIHKKILELQIALKLL